MQLDFSGANVVEAIADGQKYLFVDPAPSFFAFLLTSHAPLKRYTRELAFLDLADQSRTSPNCFNGPKLEPLSFYFLELFQVEETQSLEWFEV